MAQKRKIDMRCLAILLGGASLVVSLLCMVRVDWAPLNLLRFAAIPFFYLTGILVILFVMIRQPVAAGLSAAAAILLCVSLFFVLTPYLPAEAPNRPRLRLLFANMYFDNPTPEKLLPFIRSENPDIIIMVESSPQERAFFTTQTMPAYPYVFFYGETHVLSKYPFDDLGYEPIGHTAQGLLVHGPDGTVNVEVLHFSRPWPFADRADMRRNPPEQAWLLLKRLANAPNDNMFMVGDFNATADSSIVNTIAKGMQMRVVPTPVGTWPSQVLPMFRVSFDNALFGADLSITRRRVGPNVGSDHTPVVFDIQKRSSSAVNARK